MAPGEPYPVRAMIVNTLVGLTLFVALFLSVFWTPGLLLLAFVGAYAADSQAFSHVLRRDVRVAEIRVTARRYRGGWLDSLARAD